MHPLEERIGYKFRNPLLLAEALTHPSLGHETQQRHFDNQRLEFLGDAILQLVITEYLFGHFKDQPEGQLTKLRSRLVSRDALKAHAAAIDLGQFLLMGRGEEASGGRARTSTLADAFEALIGAIYLDGGLEETRKFILTQAKADLAQLAEEPVDINPKGNLQELLQSISPKSPVYEVLVAKWPRTRQTIRSAGGMGRDRPRERSRPQQETGGDRCGRRSDAAQALEEVEEEASSIRWVTLYPRGCGTSLRTAHNTVATQNVSAREYFPIGNDSELRWSQSLSQPRSHL